MESEKLIELKRKLSEKIGKNEAILFELKILNSSFAEIKDLLLAIKKIENVANNEEIINVLNEVKEGIDKVSEIRIKNVKELPTPNVIIPSKLEISNISEAKSDKVKINNWQDMPKPEKISFSPIESLRKSIETVLSSLSDRLSNFMNSILDYIREPDKVIIKDNSITEFYGNRKKVYRIKDNIDNIEVTYES